MFVHALFLALRPKEEAKQNNPSREVKHVLENFAAQSVVSILVTHLKSSQVLN